VQAHTGLTAALWMRRIKLRQASEAGLHRAFRQATGQTPLAYRMAHGAR